MSDLEDIEVWWKRLCCIRNPGTHTGEEAARDAEIKELRKALAERVSHLELLKKYMAFTFDFSDSLYSAVLFDINTDDALTDEEKNELSAVMYEVRYE